MDQLRSLLMSKLKPEDIDKFRPAELQALVDHGWDTADSLAAANPLDMERRGIRFCRASLIVSKFRGATASTEGECEWKRKVP